MALEKLFTNRINMWAWMKNLGEKNIGIFTNSGAPTNGTSGTGAGKLGPGAIIIDTVTGTWYFNGGTRLSPLWNVTGPVVGLAGLGVTSNAKMTYDFTVDGGAASSTIIPLNSPTLPAKSIILGGTVDVTVACVGAGSISLGTSAGSAVNSLKAADIAANYAINTQVAIIPVFTAATYVKMSAAGRLCLATTVGTITAGRFDLNVVYVVGN